MDRETIQVALTGQRQMTHEELTAAFFNLNGRMEKEELFSHSIRDTVVHNADVLDQVYQKTAKHQVDLGILAFKTDQSDQALVNAITNIDNKFVDADKRLRDQIDTVMAEVDKKLREQHDILQRFIAESLPALSSGPASADDARVSSLAQEMAQLKGVIVEVRELVVTSNTTVQAQLGSTHEVAQRALSTADSLSVRMAEVSSTQNFSSGPAAQQGVKGDTPADPFASGNDAWSQFRSAANGAAPAAAAAPPMFAGHGPGGGAGQSRPTGRWSLYDEKYHLNRTGMFNEKTPEVWLQDVHDYMAGRTQELDQLINWAEQQTEEITPAVARSYAGCLDCASIEEVSRQLWAFIGPLVKENSDKASVFRNVPRHNGLEAWRRIAEPINEDKCTRRKELLPLVTNPRSAGSLDDFEGKLVEWETNCRLMVENGGESQSDETKRLALIEMLPPEINSYVTLHMDEPRYDSFEKVKKFAKKFANILLKQKKKGKAAAHLVEEDLDLGDEGSELSEESYVESQAEALSIMRASSVDLNTQAAVLAILRGRSQRQPRQNGRFTAKRPGGPGGDARAPPARDRRDLSCVNCGNKGHIASECRQPKRERKDQPCFRCKKTGHQAKDCPDNTSRPIKSLETSGAAAPSTVRALCVTSDIPLDVPVYAMTAEDADGFRLPRKARALRLCDYMVPKVKAGKLKGSRFRQLEEKDLCTSGCCGQPAGEEEEREVIAVAAAPDPIDSKQFPALEDPAPPMAAVPASLMSAAHMLPAPRFEKSNADDDMDSIIREAWLNYLGRIPEGDIVPAWGSNKWHRWMMSVDLDAYLGPEEPLCQVFEPGVHINDAGYDISPESSEDGDWPDEYFEIVDSDNEEVVPQMLSGHLPNRQKSLTRPSRSSEEWPPTADDGRPAQDQNIDRSNSLGPGPHPKPISNRGCTAFGGGDDLQMQARQLADIFRELADPNAANEAVLRVAAQCSGITNPDEIKRVVARSSSAKLVVPKQLRELMLEMGIGHQLKPVNLFTIQDDPTAVLLADSAWQDVEFEVALDSGAVVHVCSEFDTPGYLLQESPGSRVKQNFVMGDGGKTPNLGQKSLNLEDGANNFQSIFQIAAVTRPLMSVGRICDNDNEVTFSKTKAVVRDKDGQDVCTFQRQPGGLYTARLKLKAPSFGRPA